MPENSNTDPKPQCVQTDVSKSAFKFRAWNDKIKWMSKPFKFGQVLNFHDQIIKSLTDDEIVMQFTGLTDKNGIEIYEGDLLEFKSELGKHNLHKVFRVTGGLVINSHKDDFYRDYTPFWEACADMQTIGWIKQCVVIGNIHETSELLLPQSV